MKLMQTAVWAVAASLTLAPSFGQAREPDNLAAIQREARIVADVMRSALRNEMKNTRITTVNAEYLPRQGVLISVKMSAPWLEIDQNESTIQINGNNIDLEQIPVMVENILADLQIDVTPYEPEALNDLRALRAEQRQLRLEQRQIRSDLRRYRRELVRTEGETEQRRVEEQIAALERELAAVDAQYEALAKDIDAQYDDLRDYRVGTSEPPEPAAPSGWDNVIAQSACDYGATLKSLSSENYLTVALRRGDTNEYFTFKMDHIKACNSGDMRTERLLELAYQYQS